MLSSMVVDWFIVLETTINTYGTPGLLDGKIPIFLIQIKKIMLQ